MEIRFALIPPALISKMAARLAQKYARCAKHRFLVDNKTYFPHNTLCKVNVSKKNYPLLLSVVKKELNNFKAFYLEIIELQALEGGWLELKINLPGDLNKLRKNLFRAIEDSKLTTKAVLKPNYRPHITLTRFYKKDPSIFIKGKMSPRAKFTVRDIGLCLSRQTQVYKILNIVKLK